ncbi:unnamed protein product [Hyaloperonospora brassicae]|nr:unnamed protein product [Hyaloperonospora brassicae]
MFSTEEGASELAAGAGFSRLILVAFGRGGHAFESTAKVQEELNAKIMELAPDTLGAGEKIPYLTVEEGLGARNIVHRSTSSLSGAFFVEDVKEDGELLRRLVFLSNTNVIQSEVKLQSRSTANSTPPASVPVETDVQVGTTNTISGDATTDARKKKKNKKQKNRKKDQKATAKHAIVDTAYLAFGYHKGMIAALHAASLSANTEADMLHRTLVLGLGGGCLAQYLHDNIAGMDVTVCEIDPVIVTVAEQYFGFHQDERMRVVVADALEYIAEQSAAAQRPSFDSIIVDVDAKQRDVGMSCPPVSFVEVALLQQVHSLLSAHGVLLINVSCRDSNLYKEIIARLERVFTDSRVVFAMRPGEQDVNSVVFVRKTDAKGPDAKTLLQQLHGHGRRCGKAQNTPCYVDDELCELIRDIEIAK